MLLFMCKYTLILLLSKEKVKNYNPEHIKLGQRIFLVGKLSFKRIA